MGRSHRTYVSYIDRSRKYYAAKGYAQPYRWAYNDSAPFTPLAKPLSECRVGLVTTSSLDADRERELFFASTSPPPTSMATAHLFWHQKATHTNDLGSFLPLKHLSSLATDGVIGSLAPQFAGAPTLYSQRRTNKNAQLIADGFRDDGVDLAILAPL